MADLFEFRSVGVVFDDTKVLSGISTTIPEGRLTVVAGASGSGKTTLLRLCNRLEVATSGQIFFRGQELLAVDPRQLRRTVGMVFQRPVMFAGTVRANLLIGTPDASDATLHKVLDDVELDGSFLERVGDDLSGGEAQRVCLARTLLCQPDVLLMDEPTASLHEAAAQALEATATKLRSEAGVGIIWVTHDIRQIERLAEHLLVLDRGKVRYAGDAGTAAADAALASLSTGEES